MTTPRILVFVADDDPFPDGYHYLAWGLRAAWLRMGFDVQVAHGLREFQAAAPADLILPHFDWTRRPAEIQEALDGRDNVVNGRLDDISKRVVSRNLVKASDDWDGPVIVKTDRNAGGQREAKLARRRRSLARRALGRLKRMMPSSPADGRIDWRTVDVIERGDYPVFPSREDVPEGVWENPNLVVERFLPEREGDLYHLRWFVFFGDRYCCIRIASREPVVKGRSIVSWEAGSDVPPEVLEIRAALGMDFGRIDFVVHDGRPIVLDMNKTPGPSGPRADSELRRAGPLAFGFRALLEHGPGRVLDLTHVNTERTGFEPEHLEAWRDHIDVGGAPPC